MTRSVVPLAVLFSKYQDTGKLFSSSYCLERLSLLAGTECSAGETSNSLGRTHQNETSLFTTSFQFSSDEDLDCF